MYETSMQNVYPTGLRPQAASHFSRDAVFGVMGSYIDEAMIWQQDQKLDKSQCCSASLPCCLHFQIAGDCVTSRLAQTLNQGLRKLGDIKGSQTFSRGCQMRLCPVQVPTDAHPSERAEWVPPQVRPCDLEL